MPDYVAAQASVLLVPSVKGFRDKLRTALSTIDENVKVGIDLQKEALEKAALEIEAFKKAMEAEDIDLKVKVDEKGVTKSLTEIQHKHQDFKKDFEKALTLNLKIEGLALLPQAGAALASLNQSFVALAESATVLPGMLAGIGSSLGTLKIGTHSIREAIRDFTAEQKNSVQAARQQRDALRSVDMANRDLIHTTKEAKREIEDLNDKLRDAPLDQADALIELQEAQKEAANWWGKTALQRQKDDLAVLKANSNLLKVNKENARTAQDAAEANAKGVANNDQVVAATDRLADAKDRLNKGDKFTRGLAFLNLSPVGKEFVQQITGMKQTYEEFRNTVQDHLFAHLGDDIGGLAKNLPVVQSGMVGIADSLNNNVRTAIGSLGKGQNIDFMSRIFGNTADAQGRVSKAIDPLVSGFARLGAVGSDSLPRLADAFTKVGEKFDSFVIKSDENGSLKKWIDEGLKAFDELGNTLKNTGSILHTISDTFTGQGGKGFLQVMAEGTEKLASFLKSADGQQKLITFFTDCRTELAKFKPFLDELPALFKNVKDAIKDWADTSLPVLTGIGNVLKEHPGMVTAIFDAYMTWKNVTPVISGIKGALDNDLVGACKRAMEAVGTSYKSGGLTGAIGTLATSLGKGVLLAALGAAVAYLANDWIQAEDRAAEATSRHAAQVERLKTGLDSVTGSLTKQGKLQGLQDAAKYKTDGTGEYDVPKLAEDRGINRSDLGDAAFDPTQKKKLSDQLTQLDAEQQKNVEGSNFWKRYGDQMRKHGLTSMDVAQALNGDPAAVEKYRKAADDIYHDGGSQPNLAEALIGAGVTTGHPTDPIGQDARDTSAVGNFLRSSSRANQNSAQVIQRDNQGVNGAPPVLNDVGKNAFGQYGNPRTAAAPDGGVDITVDSTSIPQSVIDELQKSPGAYVRQDANSTTIHLDKVRAGQYSNVTGGGIWRPDSSGAIGSPGAPGLPGVPGAPDYTKVKLPANAGGGPISGPGSGTSDSVLSRLSDGEYVIKAASASKYGADFLDSVNAGTFPGYWEGGPIGSVPLAPPPVPVPPPAPVPNLGSVLAPTPSGPAVSGLPPWLAPGGVAAGTPLDGGGVRFPGLPEPIQIIPAPQAPPPLSPEELRGQLAEVGIGEPGSGKPAPTPHRGTGKPPGKPTQNQPHIPVPLSGVPPLVAGPGNFPPPLVKPAAPGVAMPGVPGAGAGLPPQLLGMAPILQNALKGLGGIILRGIFGFFGLNADAILGPLMQIIGGATGGKSGGGILGSLFGGANPGAQADINGYGLPQANAVGFVGSGGQLANGATYVPKFGGSGALQDTAGSARSAVANAPINPDANILDYLAQVSRAYGLQAGSGPTDKALADSLGIWTHDNDGAQHSFNRALDIGSSAQAKSGEISSFVNEWISDPSKVASTRQLIFRGPDRDYGIINGRLLSPEETAQVYGGDLPEHTDHAHVALEGVPASAFAAGGGGAPFGGGMPQVQLASAARPASGGSTQEQVHQAYTEAGFDDAQWGDLDWIMGKESGWKTDARNPGSGAFGLFQFLGHQNDKYGQLGGYSDSAYQQGVAGMAYIKDRYGSPAAARAFWESNGWYATGGPVKGAGTGRSDSITAHVSNGEYIVNAASVGKYGLGLMDSINAGSFADGGIIDLAGGTSPNIPPAAMKTADNVPQLNQAIPAPSQMAGQPQAVNIHDDMQPDGDPNKDPRSKEGDAPQNQDHNLPALSQGVQGIASTIGSWGAMAAQMGITAAAAGSSMGAGAPAGAAAAGLAAQGIQGGAQLAGQVATGALNILSSFLVGTAPGSKGSSNTAGPYGAPLLPQQQSASMGGPAVVNNYSGGIHVGNYDQFYQGQQRREAQQAQPYISGLV